MVAAPSQGNGFLLVKNKNTSQQINLKGYFGGDFGCGFTQAFRVQTALGFKGEKQKLNFTVFLFPVQEILTVQLKNNSGKETSLKLFNSLGQLVYTGKTEQQETRIPVNNLPSGVYLLKCQTGEMPCRNRWLLLTNSDLEKRDNG